MAILNEHPISYLDEMQEQLEGLLESGPWGAWKQRPGGVFLLRGDSMGEADRVLLATAARAVLNGDRGELANRLYGRTPAAVAGGSARSPGSDRPKRRSKRVPRSSSRRYASRTAWAVSRGRSRDVITLDGDRETRCPGST